MDNSAASASDSVEIISVHIPKTAGETFGRIILPQIYSTEQIYYDYESLPVESLQDKITSKTKVIHGHFPAIKYQKAYPNAKIIVWLRNPINYLISWYYFWLTFPTDHPTSTDFHKYVVNNQISFEEFINCKQTQNFISIYYCQGINLENFHFIGIQEFFREDLRELQQLLNWPEVKVTPSNRNTYPDYEDLVRNILSDQQLIGKIVSLNSADMDLYQNALNLRAKRKGLSNYLHQTKKVLEQSQAQLHKTEEVLEQSVTQLKQRTEESMRSQSQLHQTQESLDQTQDDTIKSRNDKITSHWSSVDDKEVFGKQIYWLANPIVNRWYHSKAVGGKTYSHWVNLCVDYYLGKRCPVDKILSVGCGEGSLERHLATLNAFKGLDAVDISPERVEKAREKAREYNITGINYFIQNIETENFPQKDYDAIFYNMSLHHMFHMETIICKTIDSLKPNGFLFINEYVGPNRFEFSNREQEVIQSLYSLIPEKYRYSLAEQNFGYLKSQVSLPNPSEVANVDPSEAVCSKEIIPTLQKYCNIIELNKIGGTVLQFLLQNIAGHFREDDPESVSILNLILKAEEILIDIGDLESHFALIVAQPKSPGQI